MLSYCTDGTASVVTLRGAYPIAPSIVMVYIECTTELAYYQERHCFQDVPGHGVHDLPDSRPRRNWKFKP
jgi:hypothetical protein